VELVSTVGVPMLTLQTDPLANEGNATN